MGRIMKRVILIGVFAIGASAIGMAQDWRDVNRDRRDIYRDRVDLRQDYAKLQRDQWRGDWRAVQRDRADIARDRVDIRRDYADVRQDRRDYYRDGWWRDAYGRWHWR